jgi:predicted PurR-regulated permease PerM
MNIIKTVQYGQPHIFMKKSIENGLESKVVVVVLVVVVVVVVVAVLVVVGIKDGSNPLIQTVSKVRRIRPFFSEHQSLLLLSLSNC